MKNSKLIFLIKRKKKEENRYWCMQFRHHHKSLIAFKKLGYSPEEIYYTAQKKHEDARNPFLSFGKLVERFDIEVSGTKRNVRAWYRYNNHSVYSLTSLRNSKRHARRKDRNRRKKETQELIDDFFMNQT